MNIKDVLNHLNTCKKKGFIYENYSPNSSCKYERKYFTNENAKIIDGIRCQIEEWYKSKQITQKEYIHLIAILIETTSLYSNIPGTYGAFLKKWDSRALKTLTLDMEIHKKLLCHSDTVNNKTTNSSAHRFIAENTNNWKGWECYSGVEQIVVDFDGTVMIGWCRVGGSLGNMKDPTNIAWPSKPVTCNKSYCHCNFDIMSKKVLLVENQK